MPLAFCTGEPTIRQPPPEMMAAPPGSQYFSNARARAPASLASMPAAMPAAPEPMIAMSVRYCMTPVGVSPLLRWRVPITWDQQRQIRGLLPLPVLYGERAGVRGG